MPPSPTHSTNGPPLKTKRHSVISELWDVVVVPFPFTERADTKRRPALALSTAAFNESGHTVLAMITSKSHPPWPGDTDLDALEPAGLKTPCMIRLKLFTLDNRLILNKIGRLSPNDRTRVAEQIRRYIPLTP
ncbi:MAG: type II toxin-antitoxin system PemK/MazF family toxin [Nitrospirae bacterium]|nr:type II toxin-antitoxin system PemK/MazF family toxin [Nitrospirota bacterium]